MLTKVFQFEWHYHSRQLSFMAAVVLFFVMGFFGVHGNFGGADVKSNSPFATTFFLSLLSLMSLFVITIFCANAVLRDSQNKMESIIYTTAITKFQYLFGRFAGLVCAVFAVLAIAALGMFLGSFLVEAERLGPVKLWNYAGPLFIFGIPNILFSAALLFAVATLTRSTVATYVAGVLIYVLYFVASIFGNSPLMASATPTGPQNELLPVLLDPYGMVGFMGQARFWTPFERNIQFIALEGNFLLNRIFWSGCAILIFSIVYKLFAFRVLTNHAEKRRRKKRAETHTEAINWGAGSVAKNFPELIPQPPSLKKRRGLKLPLSLQERGLGGEFEDRKQSIKDIAYQPLSTSPQLFASQWAAFLSKIKLEISVILKSIPFFVLMLLWIFLVSIEVSEPLFSGIKGIASYPASGLIVTLIHEPLTKIGIFIVIFYGAELLWRERSAHIDELIDSTPASNAVMLISKFAALTGLVGIVILSSILTGIVIQAVNSYYHFEPEVYLSLVYYGGYPLLLIAALALFIQTIISRKYLGMILTGAFFIFIMKKRTFGLEHPLLRYAMAPELIFSDMNGTGHYADSFHWLMLYWSAAAGLLVLIAIGLWQRGIPARLKHRVRSFSLAGGRNGVIIAAVCFILLLASGGYIFYQTNIRTTYMTAEQSLDYKADYEKRYRPFAARPQLSITAVKTTVDLYPEERRYHINGTFGLKNKTGAAIDTIIVGVDPEVTFKEFVFPNTVIVEHDNRFGQFWLKPNTPLQPGDEVKMEFTVDVAKSGFLPFNSENSIVGNASYIEVEKYIPYFGYSSRNELHKARDRRKRDLPEENKATLPGEHEPQYYDWIDFETVISTTSDQTVLSVGELQKDWQENGRRYFHFKSNQPVSYMFACASATYETVKTSHNGIDIELYYQPGHTYNVERMLSSAKQSLDYFAENFSPYQYQHLRIAEIPHYIGGATAYPGAIFATEKIGFLSDMRNPEKIDYVFLLMAHELAHQWWPYQMPPADVAGYKVLTETLANYAEMLILEDSFGKPSIRAYLKNELDGYLASRGYDPEESPLYISAGRDEFYIHYQKGAIVMHALKELLGREALNTAIKNLMVKKGIPNSRATTLDFLEELYKVTPETHHRIIDDWMKKIVIYDLKIASADYTLLDDSRYRVDLKITAQKNEVNSNGEETPLPIDEHFDIAIFSKHPDEAKAESDVLYFQKHYITQEATELSLIVEKEPSFASIDPYICIVDRNRFDNIKAVEVVSR